MNDPMEQQIRYASRPLPVCERWEVTAVSIKGEIHKVEVTAFSALEAFSFVDSSGMKSIKARAITGDSA